MINVLEAALDEIVRSSFLGLQGRQPSTSEMGHHRQALLRGARLDTVLSEIAALGQSEPGTRDRAAETPDAIRHLYRLALNRQASEDEVALWSSKVAAGELSVAGVVSVIATSPEAAAVGEPMKGELSDGRYVQMLFEIILLRGAQANEIELYRKQLAEGSIDRRQLLQSFLRSKMHEFVRGTSPSHDPSLAYLLGTDRFVDLESWDAAEPDKDTMSPGRPPRGGKAPPAQCRAPVGSMISLEAIGDDRTPTVSIITSLYKGGKYIQAFMENICSQTIFADCELIIIDADSPEGEQKTIEEFSRLHSNIHSIRLPSRIGIYEAWNYGISVARGTFLTNANLDDLRRSDSLEQQLATFSIAPFADVVYQDVYYSFDFKLTFEEIAARGFKTNLPVVSTYNLLQFNSPHNAPMWRRSLHDELGFFDGSYKSAGDKDFWLRCIASGKVFYKSNDAHVVYYVNPEGLSTSAETRGIEEDWRITRIYGRKLISPRLLESDEDFEDAVIAAGGSDAGSDPAAIRSSSKRRTRYDRIQQSLRDLSARTRVG